MKKHVAIIAKTGLNEFTVYYSGHNKKFIAHCTHIAQSIRNVLSKHKDLESTGFACMIESTISKNKISTAFRYREDDTSEIVASGIKKEFNVI